jgi:hypothetical protein
LTDNPIYALVDNALMCYQQNGSVRSNLKTVQACRLGMEAAGGGQVANISTM